MVHQATVLLALFVGATAASDVCEDGACKSLPRKGRALLQVAFRDSPSQQTKTPVLEKYVENELLPQAEATRQALQTEMDTLYASVENCSNIMHEHDIDIHVEQTSITLTESKHRECDVAQQKKIDDKDQKCGEVKSLLASMTVPASLESVRSKGDPAAVNELLLQHYNFFTEYAPKLTEAQEGCRVATEVFEKHGKTCESEMEALGMAICALKSKLSKECADYEECYAWRVSYIKPEVEKVKKLEEHNKNEFRYRTCFGVDGCDQASVDVSSLSIKYPPMPAKGTCIQGTHTKFSYPNLDCGAVVAATTAAPDGTIAAPAETTAAPAETIAAPAETTAAAAVETTTAAPTEAVEATTMAPAEIVAPAAAAAAGMAPAPAAEEVAAPAPALATDEAPAPAAEADAAPAPAAATL